MSPTPPSADPLAVWQRARARGRAAAAALVLALGAALLTALGWIARPPPLPVAQAGRVLPGGVVVVGSPAARVGFYGLERLHPFDIGKYDRILDALVAGGALDRADLRQPGPGVAEAALAAVHDGAYLAGLRDPATLSRALEVSVPAFMDGAALDRRVLGPMRAAVGGTIVAAEAAVQHGVGLHIGGGFHHAAPAQGGGFCVYNDVAAAVHALRAEGFDGRVLIVDTDAHQGDGNHAFFAEDPSVVTLSLHQRDLFPHPKVPGDRDVELRPGAGDAEVLAALDDALPALLRETAPALVVHVAGSDVLDDDPLAGLAMSPAGLVERDRRVFRHARRAGAAYLHLLSGGYGPSSARAQAASLRALIQDAPALSARAEAGSAGSQP